MGIFPAPISLLLHRVTVLRQRCRASGATTHQLSLPEPVIRERTRPPRHTTVQSPQRHSPRATSAIRRHLAHRGIASMRHIPSPRTAGRGNAGRLGGAVRRPSGDGGAQDHTDAESDPRSASILAELITHHTRDACHHKADSAAQGRYPSSPHLDLPTPHQVGQSQQHGWSFCRADRQPYETAHSYDRGRHPRTPAQPARMTLSARARSPPWMTGSAPTGRGHGGASA
jgi:hypothetical protein